MSQGVANEKTFQQKQTCVPHQQQVVRRWLGVQKMLSEMVTRAVTVAFAQNAQSELLEARRGGQQTLYVRSEVGQPDFVVPRHTLAEQAHVEGCIKRAIYQG
jgi:hypothetical protein